MKELQTEKESLESNATEEVLKGHALKLLENGNYQLRGTEFIYNTSLIWHHHFCSLIHSCLIPCTTH